MKKWIALFLAVVLSAFCFAGCKNDDLLSPKDPVILSLWHVYGEQAESPMNRMVEEFNATVGKEKGIYVSVTHVTSSSKIWLHLSESLEDKPGAAQKPDLFSCHSTVADLVGHENLVDWNAYFTKDELSDYVEAFVEDGTTDGRLTVFPVSKSTYALYLNGAEFDRFAADTGVTEAQLSDWDGFFDAAEKYYNWSGGKPFCALDYLIRHVEFDLLSTEGSVSYTENGWYHASDAGVKNAWMRFALPLVQGHIAVSDLYANTQVMTGETLAGIGSTAAIIYYNDTVTYPDGSTEPMDLRVLPLPKHGGEKEYMPQTGVGLASIATTEQKAQAASVFLHWFTEGKRNLDFVAETGYMPVHDEAYAAIEAYSFPNAGYQQLYAAILTMRNTCQPVVRPDFDRFYDMTDQLYTYLREKKEPYRESIANGTDPMQLAEESWEYFCSVEQP